MTETERIMDAAEFMYKSQGYVDLALCSKMCGTPELVVANVLEQHGFKEVVPGQYCKA